MKTYENAKCESHLPTNGCLTLHIQVEGLGKLHHFAEYVNFSNFSHAIALPSEGFGTSNWATFLLSQRLFEVGSCTAMGLYQQLFQVEFMIIHTPEFCQ